MLEGALEGREHLAGPLTVADFSLAAHYSLAAACGLDLSGFPRVTAWLERMLARPSLQRALAEAAA